MIEYEMLRQATGGSYWQLVKLVKKEVDLSWRAPLTKVFGGPLRIVSENPAEGNVVATFECGSRLFVSQKGLTLVVTY